MTENNDNKNVLNTVVVTKKKAKEKTQSSSIFPKILVALLLFAFLLVTSAFALVMLVPNSAASLFSGFNSGNPFNFSNTGTNSPQQSNSTPAIANAFTFAQDTNAKNVKQIIEKALPSVVSIRVASDSRSSLTGESAGTGYFVTGDGLIISNRHVVSQVCRENSSEGVVITGLTSDQKAYRLEVLSIDPIDDVAILRVKDNGGQVFNAVNFSDSRTLGLGSDVIAIGNVLGEFSHSVTKGIVSGKDRSLQASASDPCTGGRTLADGLIQTDAAINKGNSGGPLFDAAGNVIGMNTFGTQDAQNIGFAIPSETIVNILNIYREKGKIIRPRLGVSTVTLDAARKVENSWLPVDYGELVFNSQAGAVNSGSAAEKAGIKEGDIILEVDGKKLVSGTTATSPLRREILSKKADAEIELTVLRSQGTVGGIDGGYKYAQTPEKIKVKLGAVEFTIRSGLTS
jgi:S1-C subfamily serine protease